jgi:hypothetical protein
MGTNASGGMRCPDLVASMPGSAKASGAGFGLLLDPLAIFEHIEVGEEGHITGTTLTPVYDALSAWQPGLGRPHAQRKGGEGQGRQCSPFVRPGTAAVHS